MTWAVKGKDFTCVASFSPHHTPEPFSFNRRKKLGCLEVKCFAQRTTARKGKSQDSNQLIRLRIHTKALDFSSSLNIKSNLIREQT